MIHFKLANAGLGGTSFDDFNRLNFIKFSNQGTGYQVFKYPDIKLNIKYELKNTDVGCNNCNTCCKRFNSDIISL